MTIRTDTDLIAAYMRLCRFAGWASFWNVIYVLPGHEQNERLLPFGVIQSLLAVILAAVGKALWDAQGHGTPDHIDALVTILGGAAMLGWLMCAAPFFVSLQTGVFR